MAFHILAEPLLLEQPRPHAAHLLRPRAVQLLNPKDLLNGRPVRNLEQHHAKRVQVEALEEPQPGLRRGVAVDVRARIVRGPLRHVVALRRAGVLEARDVGVGEVGGAGGAVPEEEDVGGAEAFVQPIDGVESLDCLREEPHQCDAVRERGHVGVEEGAESGGALCFGDRGGLCEDEAEAAVVVVVEVAQAFWGAELDDLVHFAEEGGKGGDALVDDGVGTVGVTGTEVGDLPFDPYALVVVGALCTLCFFDIFQVLCQLDIVELYLSVLDFVGGVVQVDKLGEAGSDVSDSIQTFRLQVHRRELCQSC
ncbi:hypothetical protein B5807_00534 [Epicoccum nigrum]|uniref:Uncharacterized protein n=1 Tax=Epicoccum nigrum TaxID=105696 RepID=A0A1Y2MDJ7_EPING|nr:hypothetical protein B5807_00534 [Epicoccum nigrum]